MKTFSQRGTKKTAGPESEEGSSADQEFFKLQSKACALDEKKGYGLSGEKTAGMDSSLSTMSSNFRRSGRVRSGTKGGPIQFVGVNDDERVSIGGYLRPDGIFAVKTGDGRSFLVKGAAAKEWAGKFRENPRSAMKAFVRLIRGGNYEELNAEGFDVSVPADTTDAGYGSSDDDSYEVEYRETGAEYDSSSDVSSLEDFEEAGSEFDDSEDFEEDEEVLFNHNDLESEEFLNDVGNAMATEAVALRGQAKLADLVAKNPEIAADPTEISLSGIKRGVKSKASYVGSRAKARAGRVSYKAQNKGIAKKLKKLTPKYERAQAKISKLRSRQASLQKKQLRLQQKESKASRKGNDIAQAAADARGAKVANELAQIEAEIDKNEQKVSDLKAKITALIRQDSESSSAGSSEASETESRFEAPMNDFRVAFAAVKPLDKDASMFVNEHPKSFFRNTGINEAESRRMQASALSYFKELGVEHAHPMDEYNAWVDNPEPRFFIQRVHAGDGSRTVGEVIDSDHPGATRGDAAEIGGYQGSVVHKDGMRLREPMSGESVQHPQFSKYYTYTLRAGNNMYDLKQVTASQSVPSTEEDAAPHVLAVFDVTDRQRPEGDPLRSGKALFVTTPDVDTGFHVTQAYINMGPSIDSTVAALGDDAQPEAQEEEDFDDFY